MDSISQWTKALPTLPEICSSWHLPGATIPIGANVRVGLFIPLSKIKISLVVFHFRNLVQFSQLHFISSMDHLMEGYFHSCPSCCVPTGLCQFIKINFKVIHSHVWPHVFQRVILGFLVSLGLGFRKFSLQK